jgi:hypothetical protein
MKAFGEYTAILGRTLWAGPDHLLCIERTGMLPLVEKYRRLDYANIQAVVMCRTSRWLWMAFWLMALMAGLGWIWSMVPETVYVIAPFEVVLLVILVVTLARGPTCKLHVQTAVQSLRLKQVVRVSQGQRVIEQLTQLCLTHQGELSPEAVSAMPSVPETAPRGLNRKAPFAGSWPVTLALLGMVLTGVFMGLEPWVPGLAWLITHASLVVLTAMLCFAALIVSYRYHTTAVVRAPLWIGTVLLCLTALGGYIGFIIGVQFSAMDFLHTVADAGVNEMGRLWMLPVIGGGMIGLLGLIGLPTALRPPGRKEAAVTPPPMPSAPSNEPPA